MIQQRITQLRNLMAERHIDAYMIPTSDFHGSEYVGTHFQCRSFMSGFTGSAGTLIVTEKEAGLWTDGRYFVQAAGQLAGSGIELRKMGEEGVPTETEYLQQTLPVDGTLGFDGRVMDSAMAEKLQGILADKQITFSVQEDLVDQIWTDRPALSAEPVWILEEKYAGKSAAEKISDLRSEMKKNKATVHILSTLDDIAWLLNLRGGDVECNPVFLSYVVVTADQLTLFVNDRILDGQARTYLDSLGVSVKPYDAVYAVAQTWKDETILLEKTKLNYAIFSYIDSSCKVEEKMNPTALMKAKKNAVEVENERRAHIKDGVAVTRFMYWLKKNIGKIPMTELSVAEKLEEFRQEQDGYLQPSFDTISAYGPNGAICHYHVTPESSLELKPRGLYLVDSGGQYYEGTTDITRTMMVGELTDEEREHFTITAMSMLRLGNVRFLYGTSGLTLDYVARELYWSRGLNFNHGTGHGVGYLLNVHERPNGIRWKMVPERQDSAALEEGMITSDEPGIYIEGSHGIRTENLVVCVKDGKNEYGQFMKFEFLTMVPIDLDAMDLSIMEPKDIQMLNDYHKDVYEKISPYFEGEELEWLKAATRAV